MTLLLKGRETQTNKHESWSKTFLVIQTQSYSANVSLLCPLSGLRRPNWDFTDRTVMVLAYHECKNTNNVPNLGRDRDLRMESWKIDEFYHTYYIYAKRNTENLFSDLLRDIYCK